MSWLSKKLGISIHLSDIVQPQVQFDGAKQFLGDLLSVITVHQQLESAGNHDLAVQLDNAEAAWAVVWETAEKQNATGIAFTMILSGGMIGHSEWSAVLHLRDQGVTWLTEHGTVTPVPAPAPAASAVSGVIANTVDKVISGVTDQAIAEAEKRVGPAAPLLESAGQAVVSAAEGALGQELEKLVSQIKL